MRMPLLVQIVCLYGGGGENEENEISLNQARYLHFTGNIVELNHCKEVVGDEQKDLHQH